MPKVKKSSYGLGARLSSQGLYNVSLTFDPKGQVCHIVHKVFAFAVYVYLWQVNLIPEEKEFLDKGNESEISSFETSFGKIAVLICADSWHPSLYQVPILMEINI